MTRTQQFLLLTRNIWLQVGMLTIVLLLARWFMIESFIEPTQKTQYAQDLSRLWFYGARYDLRITTIVLAPLYLLGLFSLLHIKSWRLLQGFAPVYLSLITLLIVGGSIGNYFYYQTYHNHFDIFVFAFFEDDTKAVMANMWDDYPIITVSLFALAIAALNGLLTRFLFQTQWKMRWQGYYVIALGIVSILSYFILARGSIGTFPLRRENAQVSELPSLNKMSPNAFMALDWAKKDKKNDVKFEVVTQEQGHALLSGLFNQSHFHQTTPKNDYLQENPPHVVFAIMEGMGMNVLQFDDAKTNDLLGDLRPAFEDDFLFTRFVSSQNGTAPSLASLLFNSPVATISHSSQQDVSLSGSIYRPYKAAGYKTVFISSGNMMWRNLANYLPRQGIDAIYDQNTLLKEYPESAKHMTDWGLLDGYAFQYAEKLLKEATEPLFVTILTVTNHPPYVTPSFYQPKPVTPTFEEKAGAGQIDIKEILTTYQYAKDALGKFISNIKNSDLVNNTIISATGDHTLRRIKAVMPNDLVIDKTVPFYLYVPKSILEQIDHKYDSKRVGSHKDILPTLYHFSLSQGNYYNIGGRNMLTTADTSEKAFGINSNIIITKEGIVNRQAPIRF